MYIEQTKEGIKTKETVPVSLRYVELSDKTGKNKELYDLVDVKISNRKLYASKGQQPYIKMYFSGCVIKIPIVVNPSGNIVAIIDLDKVKSRLFEFVFMNDGI